MKTAGKVIGYILLVALLLAGVGLIWRYTNGFNENFRTFYVEYGGERILTSSSALDFTGGTEARFGVAFPGERESLGKIVVATGGTSDLPVAEEAALTAETLGNHVVRLYDVGVAGLHRLLSHLDDLMSARCVVAVAGMEGALASVIGGLVDCPVIAVPTSVGYGASFGGLAALLSMLNSCASGCSVVNIDNGFGAGYLAGMINQMEGLEEHHENPVS